MLFYITGKKSQWLNLTYSRYKITLALEIILFKNSYLMKFYEIKICHVVIFRLYAVYKKHEMIKINYQTIEKLQYCTIASAQIILMPTAGKFQIS